MNNIFEKITRKGLTFSTVKGNISVQELWQLPLKGRNGFDLDTISRDLLSKVKSSSEESLVETVNSVDSDDELRLEVLKVVVNTLKLEQEARVNEEQARTHNRKLDQLIARKQEQELEGKSVEELLAMKK